MTSSGKAALQYQQLASSPPPYSQAVVLVPVQTCGGQTMFMATGIQQSPYIMPTQQAPVTVRRPTSQFITPSSYLVLTVVLFVLLSLFAPETLLVMIPALIVSLLSRHANTNGQYRKAKRLGNIALALNIISILVAMAIAILVISLTLSFHPWYRVNDYYYYGGGCYYDYSYEDGSGGYPVICYN